MSCAVSVSLIKQSWSSFYSGIFNPTLRPHDGREFSDLYQIDVKMMAEFLHKRSIDLIREDSCNQDY